MTSCPDQSDVSGHSLVYRAWDATVTWTLSLSWYSIDSRQNLKSISPNISEYLSSCFTELYSAALNLHRGSSMSFSVHYSINTVYIMKASYRIHLGLRGELHLLMFYAQDWTEDEICVYICSKRHSLVAVMCLAFSNRSVRLMVMMREEMMRILGNEIEMSGSQRYRLLNSRWKFAHFCS